MSTFRIVIAGCGGMANKWTDYACKRDDCEIVGLVDVVSDNAKAKAEKFSLSCPVYTDLGAALAEAKPNLVFDVSIPEAHCGIVAAALQAGCNVLGEKPMAASMDEARRMTALAYEKGLTYAVMQNRRYLPTIRAFRKLLDDGTIGDVGCVSADFFIGAHFGGFRDVMDSPLILDMAIHTFDQARFISGADPVSVYCHEFNPPGSWYKGNASAICIYEMSNGSVFNYRGSWCSDGCNTSWESFWRVNGSNGSAIWDGSNMPYADVVNSDTGFMRDMKRVDTESAWDGRAGHDGCLDEMFAALIEGRAPETVCSDNIKSMAMVFGALESAASGRKVSIDV